MRVPNSVLPLLCATAAVACGSADVAPATITASAASALSAASGTAGGVATVMTRNLYLGADLSPVLAATTPEAFVAAATGVWAMVNANDFSVRVAAIADEIARTRPDVIGLQEVYLWETLGSDGQFHAAYDYLALLLAALADRGLVYEPVVVLPLFTFTAPTADGTTVRMLDRQVILAREGVETSNAQSDVFGPPSCTTDLTCPQLLEVPVLGQQIAVLRGWTSVDVVRHGITYRFVNTHLEAFHPLVRDAQAAELAAMLAGAPERVILVGDLNSDPGTGGHLVMTSAGFTDAWSAVRPSRAGFTCCFAEDLADDDSLDERIDLVLTRGPLAPLTAEVVGDAERDRVGGLWPSDHAGVVSRVRVTGAGAFR
jgi:endonuclease/exonuclease/phosphatase family metal-dependent hydrolase